MSPASAGRPASLPQAVLQRLNWHHVAAALALAAALAGWMLLDVASGGNPLTLTAAGCLSVLIFTGALAVCALLAALVCDEFIARGARRLPCCMLAVIAACAAGTLLQLAVHELLRLPHTLYGTVPPAAVPGKAVALFFEELTWAALIVVLLVQRGSARRASASLNTALGRRADTQRATLETQLQALQARVEPQFLRDVLLQVRTRYAADPQQGAAYLADLIVYLRAALPQLRDSGATLARELELAQAYLRITNMHTARGCRCDFEVSAAACGARMPAMVLLPLLQHAAKAAAEAATHLRVAARVTGERLEICVSDSVRSFAPHNAPAALTTIQQRLRALYGVAGRLELGLLGAHGSQALMEIPFETDRRHR